jgi:tetratricopeptide (TPR) repeat protein
LYRAIGDKIGQASGLLGLGDALLMQNNYNEAREKYKQALALHREVGSKLGEANDLQGLGAVLRRQDDYSAAREWYEQALALHIAVKSKLGQTHDLQGLGAVAVLEGRLAEAEEHYNAAGQIQAGIDGARGQAGVINDHGWYLLLAQHYGAAIETCGASLALYDDHMPYFNIAHAKWLRKDADAVEHYQAGIERYHGLTEGELADFDRFIKRGLTTPEKVAELKQALGLA